MYSFLPFNHSAILSAIPPFRPPFRHSAIPAIIFYTIKELSVVGVVGVYHK
jgi:hypothetical protein